MRVGKAQPVREYNAERTSRKTERSRDYYYYYYLFAGPSGKKNHHGEKTATNIDAYDPLRRHFHAGAPLVSASLEYGVCVLLLYDYSRRGLIIDDAKHKLSSPSCGSALGLYNIVNINANVCCGRSGQRSHVDRFRACLGARF